MLPSGWETGMRGWSTALDAPIEDEAFPPWSEHRIFARLLLTIPPRLQQGLLYLWHRFWQRIIPNRQRDLLVWVKLCMVSLIVATGQYINDNKIQKKKGSLLKGFKIRNLKNLVKKSGRHIGNSPWSANWDLIWWCNDSIPVPVRAVEGSASSFHLSYSDSLPQQGQEARDI